MCSALVTYMLGLCARNIHVCSGQDFYSYISVLGMVIWSQEGGKRKISNGKDENGKLAKETAPNTAQFSQAADQQGYCGMNVDELELVAKVAFDKDFFQEKKTLYLGGYPITISVLMNGEIGAKAGCGGERWIDPLSTGITPAKLVGANAGIGPPHTSGDHKEEPRCQSGTMVFAIPYVQATIKGEIFVDLVAARGGAGVEVMVAKFSMPTTLEYLSDSQCGGVFFKSEHIGGRVIMLVLLFAMC